MTGPARILIREPRNTVRLSRTFSESLSAVEIAEPLASLDENQPVALAAEILRSQGQGSTVIGVRRAGLLTGWVTEADLTGSTIGEMAQPFDPEQVVDGSAGIDTVLQRFAPADRLFVEWIGEVTGVITRSDLQKPPVRMWLFGAITVLDANITWAIAELYPDDSWQTLITPGRLAKALALQKERERMKSHCRLVDCLQISDKAAVVTSERSHIEVFGFGSRKEAERLMRGIEALRNHLAHAQELESGHIATATKLASVIGSILRAEGVQRLLSSRSSTRGASRLHAETHAAAVQF